MLTKEQELEELIYVKDMVESPLFQKYFSIPFKEERRKLKYAYDCKTLVDMAKMKGKKEGLDVFYNCVDDVITRIEQLKQK